jgi:hypothetical protein
MAKKLKNIISNSANLHDALSNDSAKGRLNGGGEYDKNISMIGGEGGTAY